MEVQIIRLLDELRELEKEWNALHKRRWQAKERFGIDTLVMHNGWRGNLLGRSPNWPTGRFLNRLDVD